MCKIGTFLAYASRQVNSLFFVLLTKTAFFETICKSNFLILRGKRLDTLLNMSRVFLRAGAVFTGNCRVLIAAVLGMICGYLNVSAIDSSAELVSQIFINLLKLVSLPIIFLSIVSTASGMESLREIKSIGMRVIKYTLLTTITAASIALLLFVAIDPVDGDLHSSAQALLPEVKQSGSYVDYLIKAIPSNVVQPFNENHVIGVLFLAILLSAAIIALPKENRTVLHTFFSSLYAAIMKVTGWIVLLMPFAIWAFITLFFKDLRQGLEIKSLALYLLCVLLANGLQALVVLPGLLKLKGISPMRMAKGMMPALSVAFFTKSSSRCTADGDALRPGKSQNVLKSDQFHAALVHNHQYERLRGIYFGDSALCFNEQWSAVFRYRNVFMDIHRHHCCHRQRWRADGLLFSGERFFGYDECSP